MAYGLKYYHEHIDLFDRNLRIEIHQAGYSGVSSEILNLNNTSYSQGELDDDPMNAIVSLKGTIEFQAEYEDQYEEFLTAEDRVYRIDFITNGLLSASGFISTKDSERDYKAAPYSIRLKFSDGLKSLKKIDYNWFVAGVENSVTETPLKIISECLQQLGTDFGIADSTTTYADGMDTSLSPLTQCVVDKRAFQSTNGEPISYFEVLESILISFGADIRLIGGYWNIRDTDARGVQEWKYFDKTGSSTGAASTSIDKAYTRTDDNTVYRWVDSNANKSRGEAIKTRLIRFITGTASNALSTNVVLDLSGGNLPNDWTLKTIGNPVGHNVTTLTSIQDGILSGDVIPSKFNGLNQFAILWLSDEMELPVFGQVFEGAYLSYTSPVFPIGSGSKFNFRCKFAIAVPEIGSFHSAIQKYSFNYSLRAKNNENNGPSYHYWDSELEQWRSGFWVNAIEIDNPGFGSGTVEYVEYLANEIPLQFDEEIEIRIFEPSPIIPSEAGNIDGFFIASVDLDYLPEGEEQAKDIVYLGTNQYAYSGEASDQTVYIADSTNPSLYGGIKVNGSPANFWFRKGVSEQRPLLEIALQRYFNQCATPYSIKEGSFVGRVATNDVLVDSLDSDMKMKLTHLSTRNNKGQKFSVKWRELREVDTPIDFSVYEVEKSSSTKVRSSTISSPSQDADLANVAYTGLSGDLDNNAGFYKPLDNLFVGSIESNSDLDASGTITGGYLRSSNLGSAATPGLGINNSGFYLHPANLFIMSINGAARFQWEYSGMKSTVGAGGAFINRLAASNVLPVWSFVGDEGTGLGRLAAGRMSLITNSSEIMRLNGSNPLDQSINVFGSLRFGPTGNEFGITNQTHNFLSSQSGVLYIDQNAAGQPIRVRNSGSTRLETTDGGGVLHGSWSADNLTGYAQLDQDNDWTGEQRFRSSFTKFYSTGSGYTNRRLTINITTTGLAQFYNYDESLASFHDFEFGGTSTPGTGLYVDSGGNTTLRGLTSINNVEFTGSSTVFTGMIGYPKDTIAGLNPINGRLSIVENGDGIEILTQSFPGQIKVDSTVARKNLDNNFSTGQTFSDFIDVTNESKAGHFKVNTFGGWIGLNQTDAYLQFGTTHSYMRLYGSYYINLNSHGYNGRNFVVQNNGTELYRIDADNFDHYLNGRIIANGGNSTSWNEAYSWGDHSLAGYLTLVNGIAYADNFKVNNWDGWIGFDSALSSLTFGTFTSYMRLYGSYTIDMNQNGYGGRNFYIKNNGVDLYRIEADTLNHYFNGTLFATGGDSIQWNNAYSWGDHSQAGYATQSWVSSQGYITSADGGDAGTLDGLDSTKFARRDIQNTFATTQTIESQLNLNGSVPTLLFNETDETGRHRIRANVQELKFQYASDGSVFSTIFEIRPSGVAVVTGNYTGNGSGLSSVNAATLGGLSASAFNQTKGTDTDLTTAGAQVVSSLVLTDGVITSHTLRSILLSDLGYTGDLNANYITDNNQLLNGAGYLTSSSLGGYASESWVNSNFAGIGGNLGQNFSINVLRLQNNETGSVSQAGQIAYDTNDSSAPASLGAFNSNPIGLYVHDGVGVRRIWTTDNFDGSHVANWQTAYSWGDHAGLYALLAHNHDSQYEPLFSKNSAFNKDFGTSTGTIAEGNDSRIVNGQIAHGWGNHADAGYNSTIGGNSDIGTSGATVLSSILLTNGVVMGYSYRQMTLGDLGFTGDTNANYITNNNQIANGQGFITLADVTKALIDGLNVDSDTLDGVSSGGFVRSDQDDNVSANTEWQDNYQVRLGNGADLRLLHDGSNSWIRNYTGNLYIRSYAHGGNIYIQGEDSGGTNEPMIYCYGGGAVNLYWDGETRLATSSAGGTLYGTWNATTNLQINGANVATQAWVSSQSFLTGVSNSDIFGGIPSVGSIGGIADADKLLFSDNGVNTSVTMSLFRAYMAANIELERLTYESSLRLETRQEGLAVTGDVETSGTVHGKTGGNQVTASSSTATIPGDKGNNITVDMQSVVTTLNFTNLRKWTTYNVKFTQDSGGGNTITWPSSFKWVGGTSKGLTTTGNSVDILTIVTYDNTTSLYVSLANDVK